MEPDFDSQNSHETNSIRLYYDYQCSISPIRSLCNVCFWNSDTIKIYCTKCFMPVHPVCYCLEDESMDDFFICDRCHFEEECPLEVVSCKFCLHKWGAFKRFYFKGGEVFWAHITCVDLQTNINRQNRMTSKLNKIQVVEWASEEEILSPKPCMYCKIKKGCAFKVLIN